MNYLKKFLLGLVGIAMIAAVVVQTLPVKGDGLVAGGLTALPQQVLSPMTVQNPSFETIGGNGDPANWTDNGFVSDATVARTGTKSHRLTNAYQIPFSQSATQVMSIQPGLYTVGGWVKLNGLAATQGNGVRICLNGSPHPWTLGRGCTIHVKGTADWQYIEKKDILITGNPTNASITLESYGETDGTAWFDDIVLIKQIPLPVDAFLQYPNYRGMLFDDQSQTIRLNTKVTSPDQRPLSAFQVRLSVIDEADSSVDLTQLYAAQADTTLSLDADSLETGKSYLLKAELIDGVGPVYEYPAYRIVTVAGSQRASMDMTFDEQNRFISNGEPTFIIGAYDSGIGYNVTEPLWEANFTNNRRLFELPLNMYLNYWFGNTPTNSLNPMMNVLQNHGMKYLQTGNCFNTTPATTQFKINTDDAYLNDLITNPGLAGYYTMDECVPEMIPTAFTQYQRLKQFHPDGITFGASMTPNELFMWRDVVDVLSTDPYPLYGAEPSGGYPLHKVADWTKSTKDALQGSRPFLTVLQFFKATANSRWPTESELRNMSYMAITEGANGVFYWSLGANALAYVCTGWCPEKEEYFNRLKNVTFELDELKPVLTAVDNTSFLASTGLANIKARVKYVNGNYYLIAYNYSNQTIYPTFTVNVPMETISVFHESRSINPIYPNYTTFTDSFGPYQAHVYVIDPL